MSMTPPGNIHAFDTTPVGPIRANNPPVATSSAAR